MGKNNKIIIIFLRDDKNFPIDGGQKKEAFLCATSRKEITEKPNDFFVKGELYFLTANYTCKAGKHNSGFFKR